MSAPLTPASDPLPATRLPADLDARVRAWLADDPGEETRGLLLASVAAADAGDADALAEIEDAFSSALQFGTAGLRGAMGPGPNRMNLAVVSRAAAGFGDWLAPTVAAADPGGEAPRVVVGYDARHRSLDFARETARILVARGLRVLLMPAAWPTPVLAHAVRALACDGGIMVTASHNPAADNGYKVYLGSRATDPHGDGSQIVPPADSEIAARIAAVGSVLGIPRADAGWETLPVSYLDRYLDEVAALVPAGPRGLSIVHTAMHGVGSEAALRVLSKAGFTDVTSVAEQAAADPEFPTVPFPNPEEPGALDRAIAQAEETDADLVIANDPDADRCAFAVRDPHTGSWRALTGDETGVLLADHVAAQRGDGAGSGSDGVFAASVVSSRWMAALLSRRGLATRQTLTGFKWISRVPSIVFGYEEAIGFCVAPDLVRDKDGLSAAVLFADLAARLRAAGSDPVSRLDELARVAGLYATSPLSVRVDDLEEIDAMMRGLRADGIAVLAGSPVTTVADLAEGSPETTGIPPTDGMLFLTEDDTRVVIRPSGTEPKLKCYLEVVEPAGEEADMGAVRARAQAHLAAVRSDVEQALGT